MAVHKSTVLTVLVGASVINIIMLFAYLHHTKIVSGTEERTENKSQRKLLVIMADRSKKMAANNNNNKNNPQPPTIYPDLLEMLFGQTANNQTVKRQALKGPRLNRLLNVTATRYVINKENVCKDGAVSIMAIVVSAANHRQARDAIRETWGQRTKLTSSVRLIFFVGRPKENQTAILDEDEHNGDMVQADFVDSYRNLTFKSVLLLRWVIEFCPNVTYLLKVDDDVFVNVANLINLTKSLGNKTRTIVGRSAINWHPIRDKNSPYYVPRSSWNSIIYPKFVTGPSYLVTADSLPDLYRHCKKLPFFFLEDVFVTGMAAEKAGIARINNWGFHNTKTTINPCVLHRVVTSHWLSASRLKAAWHIFQSYQSNYKDCWYSKCSSYFLGVCISTHKAPVDFYPTKSTFPIKKPAQSLL